VGFPGYCLFRIDHRQLHRFRSVIIVDQSIELVDQLAKPALSAAVEPENDPR
jgi:hypothetical protein